MIFEFNAGVFVDVLRMGVAHDDFDIPLAFTFVPRNAQLHGEAVIMYLQTLR